MKDICINFITHILDTYDSMVQQVLTILAFNCYSQDDTVIGGMYTLTLDIKTIVMPVATTILTIVFLCDLLRYEMKQDVTNWQNLFVVFFKLVIGKAAMDMSFEILDLIYSTAADWITQIGWAQGTLGATAGIIIKNEISGYGTMKCLGLMITSALMFVVIIMCAIIMNVVAYARTFEIMAYTAFSPIPCAFLPMEHSRVTIKFFANFAAVCLQGCFMAFSVKAYSVICTSIISAINSNNSIWNVLYNLVLGSVICLMAIVKSGSWASKMLEGF